MNGRRLNITYVGGPTAVLELGGFRLLTDPTFDPAGEEYASGPAVLRKTAGPALGAESVGRIDAVLLSHDHHSDNLDRAGRALLRSAGRVLTTHAGAERLGGNAAGLSPWETIEMRGPDGSLRVTGTPARHGPAHLDRGPVTGFVLSLERTPDSAVYVSGDTVWYEGIEEVGRRFQVRAAVLFMGAARVAAAGPWHLTMTAQDGVEAARSFASAAIVPLHFEGWDHFTESRGDIARAFAAAGLQERLRWPEPGRPIEIAL